MNRTVMNDPGARVEPHPETAGTADGGTPAGATTGDPAAQRQPRAVAGAKPAPRRRVPKPVIVAWEHDTDAPPLIQAASLALSVLGWTRAGTVAELSRLLAAGDAPTIAQVQAIRFTAEQRALLDDPDHAGPLSFLRSPPGATGTVVTVQWCPACERWSLSYRSGVRACRATVGCTGRVIRAARAKRARPADTDLLDPTASG